MENYQKESQSVGKLKSVLAAKAAIADLDSGQTLVVSDDSGVADIQKSHCARLKIAGEESQKALAKTDQNYLASLTKLVAQLTKSGKIEQAVTVQAMIDQFTAKTGDQKTDRPQPVGNSGPESEEVLAWKKKAYEEYPTLSDPKSKLSLEIASRVKALKSSNPSYFLNPQWPYLLAQEATKNQTSPPNDKPDADQTDLTFLEGNWVIHSGAERYKVSFNKTGHLNFKDWPNNDFVRKGNMLTNKNGAKNFKIVTPNLLQGGKVENGEFQKTDEQIRRTSLHK